jgi:hypothetical protein
MDLSYIFVMDENGNILGLNTEFLQYVTMLRHVYSGYHEIENQDSDPVITTDPDGNTIVTATRVITCKNCDEVNYTETLISLYAADGTLLSEEYKRVDGITGEIIESYTTIYVSENVEKTVYSGEGWTEVHTTYTYGCGDITVCVYTDENGSYAYFADCNIEHDYQMVYEFISQEGNNCEKGVRGTRKCSVCGAIDEDYWSDVEWWHDTKHVTEVLYENEEYGCCVIRHSCLCGENSYIDASGNYESEDRELENGCRNKSDAVFSGNMCKFFMSWAHQPRKLPPS